MRIKDANRGRPRVYAKDNARKISVTLLNRQIKHLDLLKADIMGKAGKSVSRSEIIQLLVEAMIAGRFDLSSVKSLEELWDVLLDRIQPA